MPPVGLGFKVDKGNMPIPRQIDDHIGYMQVFTGAFRLVIQVDDRTLQSLSTQTVADLAQDALFQIVQRPITFFVAAVNASFSSISCLADCPPSLSSISLKLGNSLSCTIS